MQEIIAQGAEAIIIKKKNIIIKKRIKKNYRISEIDYKLRKKRTKSELKILEKASKIIKCPKPLIKQQQKFEIIMPFIKGYKLSDSLNNFPLNKQKKILNEIGKEVAKLHEKNIIHGDLTTSNLILTDNEVSFIDFGLSFQNGKYEDKAVDIHLLKQALEAKHFENWKILYKKFEDGYRSINKEQTEKTFNQLVKVEKRGRYKN
jgi:Kae1-associated kinase Bud32